jgi:hypothetical protein
MRHKLKDSEWKEKAAYSQRNCINLLYSNENLERLECITIIRVDNIVIFKHNFNILSYAHHKH